MREKGGEARERREIKFFVAIFPISCFLEIKQPTRQDFKRFKIRNQTLTSSFCDFDFGENP